MNERIRKIAIETDAWCDQHYTGDQMYNIKWEQKFAELIVRECARIIMNGGYWTDILGNRKNASPDEIAQMIKEHFGVEE